MEKGFTNDNFHLCCTIIAVSCVRRRSLHLYSARHNNTPDELPPGPVSLGQSISCVLSVVVT